MDHLCYLCLVFAMRSRLFIAALWSTEGKGPAAWFLFVMFSVNFFTFPFGILGQVWYLIVSIPDPCCLSYFNMICKRSFQINLLITLKLIILISNYLYFSLNKTLL